MGVERSLFDQADLRNIMRGQLTTITYLPDCQWTGGYMCALESIAAANGITLAMPGGTSWKDTPRQSLPRLPD